MRERSFIKYVLISTAFAAILVASCNKEWKPELAGDAPRLFRPVIKGSLAALGNYIDVAWQQSKETNKYKVELSIDSFKTVANTLDVTDTTAATIDSLLWEQLYEVRVTALHPTDPSKDSRPADFGQIKTPRFPTIVETPASSDVGWTSILFKWRNEGDPVTTVKVINPDNKSVISTVTLSATDISNAYLLIDGLKPATSYTVELYSGTKFRGGNNYTTKEQLSGIILDLQRVDPATVNLGSIVDTVAAGTTIILKRGATYELPSALTFSKSLGIMSGSDPLVSAKAKIGITGISNFNIAANANIAKLAFTDLELYSNDAAGKYLFNPSGTTVNIDELLFDNCIIRDVRGVGRFRGAIVVGKYTIENSIVYNIGGYGVMTVDDATAAVNNFTFNNSTIYNADKFVVSKNNSPGKIIISNSTFYNAVLAGAYIVDYNGTTLYPKSGIEFNNVILGRAKGSTATPPAYDIYGFRVNTATVILSSGNYTTSDFVWKTSTSAMTPSYTPYTKTSADIFTAPDAANFLIKDNGFPGKQTSGDPRWRQ
ncbi:DUF4957 domain-containing protein [Niabella soli]|uniref:DUF5123 domain-containing protein n=1 Tax=Niabella soli DSM 19437 TaxID=929713 RepID=W0F9F3_9BACT|nr:DUF4957 domain-containing protein [Niabella soli]AHF18011.1 hypothetical protein NIASO_18670 [Niabella soli DSM 19437]